MFKKVKEKWGELEDWLTTNHRNYNVGYYTIFALALASVWAPTLPFMNAVVQVITVVLLWLIFAFSYARKYHNDDWHD